MAFEPKDPNEFFSLLGPERVAAALTRGEITGELKPVAQEWFSLNHMLATQASGRNSAKVSVWQLAAGVVSAVLALIGLGRPAG